MNDKQEISLSAKSYNWRKERYRSIVPPLYLGVMHGFKDANEGAAIFEGRKKGYAYGRIGNPTVDIFQDWLADLEGGERCWAVNSGLLALLFLALALSGKKKEIAVSPRIYGGSYHQLHLLAEGGFKVRFVKDPFSIKSWLSAVSSKTAFAFLETPSNPTIDIFDIAAIAEAVHRQESLLVVDNTLGITLQKPLALGADIVLHSVTKYLNRQSIGLAGAVIASKATVQKHGEKMNEWFIYGGFIIHPLTAWLTWNNQFTLERDMRLFSENARRLADFLWHHPKVEKVYYPAYFRSPHYELCRRQMPDGAGGLLAFELKSYTAAKKFVNSLREVNLAPHLGDVRYLGVHPASTTHSRLSAAELLEANITKNLVRLSAGLGPAEKIIEELDRILKQL